MDITTYPSQEVLETYASQMPDYMHPNTIPMAVILEGILSYEECQEISDEVEQYSAYQYPKCGAMTTEIDRPLPRVFDSLRVLGEAMNKIYFEFNLDDEPAAWRQHYTDGGEYQTHTDAGPGQSRKLTAVLLLSDPTEYIRGDLEIVTDNGIYTVPPTQGTVVVYPGWVRHRVTTIIQGQRDTINMGWFGPPFV